MLVRHRTTVGRIAEDCRGILTVGDAAAIIENISTDSRHPGENGLFIPLKGATFDGHDFIRELAESQRIRSFLTMREGYTGLAERCGISEIRCEDTLGALGAMASRHRERINPTIIGVTGTNGKTTTKELIHAIFSHRGPCHKNEKNYNNEIGVPMSLLGLTEEHTIAVIEMGMNHAGEIDRLSRMVKPDCAVITSVGEGHLEFLGTVENVALAKSEIMHGMRPGARIHLNSDTACVDLLRGKAQGLGLKVTTFGLGSDAEIRPSFYRLERERVVVGCEGVEIAAALFGIHNVYNILAALSVALEYGIPPSEVREALHDFENLDGRSGIIDGPCTVIDDTYNANPLSLASALRSAAEIFPRARKIAILSDMKELGDAAPHCHEVCGASVARYGFHALLVWGPMARHYAAGALSAGLADGQVKVFDTKEDLIRHAASILQPDDVVLVKGSRSMKMEEVVRAILGKGL